MEMNETERIVFLNWLKELRKNSDFYFKKFGKWDLNTQLLHTHSEVSELYEGLRKGRGHENFLEEIWDIVFSALTNAHVVGFSDKQILEAMNKCLDKVQIRIQNNTGYLKK